MKSDIHPKVHPVIFLDMSTGAKFISTSSLKSDETEEIDGVKHYIIKMEVTSDSHPFYTGKQKLIDTTGRVDKFRAKMEKAESLKKKTAKKRDDEDEDEENSDGTVIVAKPAKKKVEKASVNESVESDAVADEGEN